MNEKIQIIRTRHRNDRYQQAQKEELTQPVRPEMTRYITLFPIIDPV
jgi:hypothetical protein